MQEVLVVTRKRPRALYALASLDLSVNLADRCLEDKESKEVWTARCTFYVSEASTLTRW